MPLGGKSAVFLWGRLMERAAKERQADDEKVFGASRMRIASFEDAAGIKTVLVGVDIAGLATAAALGL